MLDGDEVVCAIFDADADAGVAHAAGALAAATGLPLVLTAVGGLPVAGLRPLAEALPGDVILRSHRGRSAAVLLGLGRALGTALLVVPEAPGRPADLLDDPGCPLVLVSREDAATALRRGEVLRCVVRGSGDDPTATGLAELLPGEVGVIPAHATADPGGLVVVVRAPRAAPHPG